MTLAIDADCYADRGWAGVPIISKNKKKTPLVKWGIFTKRLPSDAERRGWFGKKSKANGIGIVTGAASGPLAIRDFDRIDSYEEWKANHRTLAHTIPTVRTKRGMHVWCRSDLAKTVVLDDGEFRGGPAISLAPHSEHFSGIKYEWINPLPKGDLPVVEHRELIGENVIEKIEAMASVLSAFSALSITSPLDEIITATVPTRPGERNACLFALARGLRFHPDVDSTDVDEVRGIVRGWHARALPVITTKSFDESWADFLHAFDRVKHPLGAAFIDQAAAEVDPHDLPEVAENYEANSTRRLIALCAALSRLANNNGHFFISAKVAADRTNVSPMQAWRTLNMLCRDGVMNLIKKGNERTASRYQWADESNQKSEQSKCD